MLPHDGLVEPFDVRAAVILRGEDAVMLELNHCLLYRHAAQSELVGDLVAVDPVTGAELSGQHQIDHVRDNEVLFLNPVLLRHGGDSVCLDMPTSELLGHFGFNEFSADRASGTTSPPELGRTQV